MKMNKEFENYKQRQRYYDEKYKNRGEMLLEQPPMRYDKKTGEYKKQKGVTFYKVPDNTPKEKSNEKI